MDTWIWIVGALALGVILGGGGVYWLGRERWTEAAKAQELRKELESYKQDVSDHFVQTAELVNNLTRSYKQVYDHLEQGAYRLVGEEALKKELSDVGTETVMLEYIGRRDRAAVLGAGDGDGKIEDDLPDTWDRPAEPSEPREDGAKLSEPTVSSEPLAEGANLDESAVPTAPARAQGTWEYEPEADTTFAGDSGYERDSSRLSPAEDVTGNTDDRGLVGPAADGETEEERTAG